MASGYTSEVKNGSFTIRFFWESRYDAASNTSSVTFTPQIYNETTWGGNLYACGYGISGAGIYLNELLNYAFDGSWGTDRNLECSANVKSWTNMHPRSSYISPMTIKHDANGYGITLEGNTPTVRFYGTIVPGNHESTHTSIDTGTQTISIHEDAPYSISYNANGGSGAPSSRGVYYGVSYNLSSARPTRTGYTFLGWSTSSTATTATYQPGASVTPNGNLALYAVWQLNTYTVSFDANGGEGAPDAVTKTYGTTLVLPDTEPTRTGYDFLGWSTDSEAATATYRPGGNYTANADAVLYAVWRVISFTLSATVSDRGLTANILRTASPIGGGASSLLANGDTVYYNDVIKVSWAVGGGYQAETLQINGEDVSLLTEKTITVTESPTVILVVKLGAIVYVKGVAYQAFIDNGSIFGTQYEAHIDNGSSWDAY